MSLIAGFATRPTHMNATGKTRDIAAQGYWQQARRPLVSLAFVLPLILVYEIGVVWLGGDALRNGVDVYLRNALDTIGLSQYFLLPVATCCILLAWHHVAGQPWRLRIATLLGMLLESLTLAFLLLVLAQILRSLFDFIPNAAVAASGEAGGNSVAGSMIGYFGAGIYEELLFRLMMLPVVAAIVRWCGGSRRMSFIVAVVVTSLVFAAVHYRTFTFNDHADVFQWFSFIFRFLAGVFFAVLFLQRGFGIAVGTHALYDVLVQWLFS